MKPLLLTTALLACSLTALAQQTSFEKTLNGCWRNSNDPHDLFVLNSNFTCIRIKPGGDTLHGSWEVRAVYSIPFKTDRLVMKYTPRGKDKMEIGSDTLSDYRHGGRRHYVPCGR